MNCTGKNCIMQYGKVDPATCKAVEYCPHATPPKTNADKIRAMSDEELAKWIAARIDCEVCPVSHDEPISGTEECHKRIVDWLKEKAKE